MLRAEGVLQWTDILNIITSKLTRGGDLAFVFSGLRNGFYGTVTDALFFLFFFSTQIKDTFTAHAKKTDPGP